MSNNLPPLEKLKKHKTAILLAEMAAYSHMIGKFSEEFLDGNLEIVRTVFKNEDKDNEVGKGPLKLPTQFFKLSKDSFVESYFEELRSDINCDGYSPDSLAVFSDIHKDRIYISYCNKENKKIKDNYVIKTMLACHKGQGEEEKKGKGEQKQSKFISTAFGFEKEIKKDKLKEQRDNLCEEWGKLLIELKQNKENVDDIYLKWHKFLKKVKKDYSQALADTQRPINDITLWDGSYLVAAFMKSALAKYILKKKWDEPIEEIKKQNDKVKLKTKWRLLKINIPIYNYISKGHKIGDILGRRNKIDRSLKGVKELLEVKFPVGNEIYRDDTGIYFSFPDVDMVFFKNKIKDNQETLFDMISKQIKNADDEISFNIELSDSLDDFSNLREEIKKGKEIANFTHLENISLNCEANGKEICKICRVRYVNNKDHMDICSECKETREKRLQDWIKNCKSEENVNTIWLDEVADKNGRIALLVGKFDLDPWLSGEFIEAMGGLNPSSGRVRRVWNTTLEFFEGTVIGNILENYSFNNSLRTERVQFEIEPLNEDNKDELLNDDKPKVFYVKIGGHFLSMLALGKKCVLLGNLEMLGTSCKKIEDFFNKNSVIEYMDYNSPGKWKKANIFNVEPADNKYLNYRPWIDLYKDPDQFMVLVPAKDAVNIQNNIIAQYEEQFSKVRDRLPLHLGVVFFPKKQPLYTVMEAGKRIFNKFNKDWEVFAKIEKVAKKGEITFINMEIQDRNFSGKKIEWAFQYTNGDNKTIDYWHPILRDTVKDNFITDIDKDIQLKIKPSLFTYHFMESNASRFEAGKDILLMDDYKTIHEIWNELKKNKDMTDSKLRNIHTLLSVKGEEWQQFRSSYGISINEIYFSYHYPENYRQFVRSVVRKDFKIKNEDEIEKWVNWIAGTEKLFDKTLELYLIILKERLEC